MELGIVDVVIKLAQYYIIYISFSFVAVGIVDVVIKLAQYYIIQVLTHATTILAYFIFS